MADYEDLIKIIEGTFGKDVNLQAQDSDGNGVDLTGCTVKWHIYEPEATIATAIFTCTEVDLSLGKVKYTLLSTDWSTTGTADSGSETTTVDAERGEADDFWLNTYITFTSGLNAGEKRRVTGFAADTDTITHEAFSNAVVTGDEYVLTRLEEGYYKTALVATKVGYDEEFPNLTLRIIAKSPRSES